MKKRAHFDATMKQCFDASAGKAESTCGNSEDLQWLKNVKEGGPTMMGGKDMIFTAKMKKKAERKEAKEKTKRNLKQRKK
jgi:hypothetical protein